MTEGYMHALQIFLSYFFFLTLHDRVCTYVYHFQVIVMILKF